MGFPNRIFIQESAPYYCQIEQTYPLGQMFEAPNGRLFRYGSMGAADGIANKLYQSFVTAGNWDALVIPTTVAAGSSTIGFTNPTTTAVENVFAEGTIVGETGTSLGHIYPVKSNTSAAGAALCTVTLADGVVTQSVLTAGTHVVCAHPNPWYAVIIKPASDQTGMVIGVPQIILYVGYYGFFCTHGMVSCLSDATTALVVGEQGRPSNSVAGALEGMDYDEAGDADNGRIAWVPEISADTDFGHAFLLID